MTIPMDSSIENDLGASGSGPGERYLGRKRTFRTIPRCPNCRARLVLIGTMKSEPTLRCGRCGAEFMNQFFSKRDADESAGPGGGAIPDELRESWKNVFGGLGK